MKISPVDNLSHPQVNLSVSCKQLGNLDLIDSMEAQVVLLGANHQYISSTNEYYQEIGRTEIVQDRNPEFITRFKMSYKFEGIFLLHFI